MKILKAAFVMSAVMLLAATSTNPGYAQTKAGTRQSKQAAKHVLGKRVEQLLSEDAIPALQQGYNDYFFASITPVLEKLDATKLESLEQLGKQLGVNSLRNETIKVLVQRIEQGLPVPDQIKKYDLAAYVIKGISEEIQSQLKDIDSQPAMAVKLELPDQGQETNDLFWDAHVLGNRFENLYHLAQYTQTLAKNHLGRAKKQKNAERIAQLEEVAKLSPLVIERYRHLLLNAAEYRLLDLDRAVSRLRASGDFESRLLAAWTLEDSGRMLIDFIESTTPADRGSRPSLAYDDLLDDVQQQMRLGMDYGKDVIDKANLLRIASFWWMRGRVGSGPLVKGLLKDEMVMQSEKLMAGLYMPMLPRKPIYSGLPEANRLPGYDRRHFQTWAVEFRPQLVEKRSPLKSSRTESYAESLGKIGRVKTFF